MEARLQTQPFHGHPRGNNTNNMKNWTIGKRIRIGFAALLALVGVLAAISMFSLHNIHQTQRTAGDFKDF